MKLRSICAFAATIGLAAAVVPASAATMAKPYFAGAGNRLGIAPASDPLIVNPILTGPFSEANPLGTILAIRLLSGNTYDFTFTMAQAASVLTQVQAAFPGTSEPIEFSLWHGAPGGGVLIATSTDSDGPSLTDFLGVGDYYLHVDVITANNELLTGGLAVIPIPEPAVWTLMLVGIMGLGATMRSMRRRPAAVTA
jgi:hypothetical protein